MKLFHSLRNGVLKCFSIIDMVVFLLLFIVIFRCWRYCLALRKAPIVAHLIQFRLQFIWKMIEFHFNSLCLSICMSVSLSLSRYPSPPPLPPAIPNHTTKLETMDIYGVKLPAYAKNSICHNFEPIPYACADKNE